MDELLKIRNVICKEHRLGEALKQLKEFVTGKYSLGIGEQLESIEEDYQRMRDFMLTGHRDAKRDEVYQRLLQRLYALVGDLDLRLRVLKQGSTYAKAYANAQRLNMSPDEIRDRLEAYVQDMAMLSLGSEDVDQRREALQTTHQQYRSMLFDALVVSPQWSGGTARFFMSLIKSPTIDMADACMMVSALMLSCMRWFDISKFLTLVHVYCRVTDEQLRQRALVAWCFSMVADKMDIFPQYEDSIKELMKEEEVCQDLFELQMQVFFCIRTDEDNQLIQRDIIPTIMKNQKFRFTRNGIEETEDDPLQDILHPDEAEKGMEELEASIQKMTEMQRAGADVYFGGFSRMKRFSFFYTLANWFAPFNIEHPGLKQAKGKLDDMKILSALFASGTFCDSDKYSFVLAMSNIVNMLPANVREILASSSPLSTDTSHPDANSPAFIRRMYLQDLFRFFRLYTQKEEFSTPFDYSHVESHLFFAFPVFASTALSKHALALLRFLLKRRMHAFMQPILNCHSDGSEEFLLLAASLCVEHGDMKGAQALYERLLKANPDHEQALKGYAYTSLRCASYDKAEEAYSQLMELHPDKVSYQLNHAIAQIQNGKAEESVKTLFKLEYEHHENLDVSRALAWGLMMLRRYEPANTIYERLLAKEEVPHSDMLNAGYCKWFMGRVGEAVQLFKRYAEQEGASLAVEMQNDRQLLEANKINDVDQQMMIDIVYNE